MTAGNLSLRELIERLEEIERVAPDAIPTTIGRDGKESLVARVEHDGVDGGHSYAVLRAGHEVV